MHTQVVPRLDNVAVRHLVVFFYFIVVIAAFVYRSQCQPTQICLHLSIECAFLALKVNMEMS